MLRLIKYFTILSLSYLAWSQCYTDYYTQVFLNRSNPYCTRYSGTKCTCCGYSQDNLYLYGSECTVGTSSDLLTDEKILKKCDPNCQSGYCVNGVCSKCNTIDETKRFYLYISPQDSLDSCVTQCEHFSGYFGAKVSENQVCSKCPSSCTVCASSAGCRECSYDRVRWSDTEQPSFTARVNEGSIDCAQHTKREKLSPTNNRYLTQLYITPTFRGCNSTIQCDGTIDNPYDDINIVFRKLIENVQIGKQAKLKINIFFLKDNDKIMHFWKEDSSLPTHYKRLFERTLINATLSPAYCDNTTKCFQGQDKPVIVIKSNLISIFATWKLMIQNIIFDGSELIPDGNCYETFKNSDKRCCDSSSLAGLPIRADPQSDAICNPGMASGALLHPFLNFDPVNDVWPFGPYSFITMQMIHDYSETEIPELIIEGCEFRHFWYHRYARSLISLNNYGSRVTIRKTSFINFYFKNGLITNVHEIIQRDTLFTENVVPNFDCTRVNSSLTNCFSLTIEDSSFRDSLFGDFEYSSLRNQLKHSAALESVSLSKNEGIMLFLVSFNGPIIIRNNIFERLASSAFSTSGITCSTPRRVTLKNLFHSLDRLIQIELGHEKYNNLQSSSVMNVRNVLRGMTIYNNTFQNNLALTGTNFFIHNFKQTDIYPIIIEKNSFKQNFAQLFGSSFAIVNYARDYVNMRCEGIYISQNTFEENFQCPNAVGNAIIACIPEKSVLSPIFSKETIPTEFVEEESWNVYYPSVNQATDPMSDHYNTITQVAFTKLYRYLYTNRAKVNQIKHPITNLYIDISGIQVLSNLFKNNYASIAHLFIQGAFKVKTLSNIFKHNSFPFSIFFPPLVSSIPIFSKVINNEESGYFVSTAFMLRLNNQIEINYDLFQNNTQVAVTQPGLTVGSAISIDRYLGYMNIWLQYTNIMNHIGLDFFSIKQLESFRSSKTANLTLQTLEQNGVVPPLITYSYWENFAGVTYSDDVDPSSFLDMRIRKSVMQGQEVGCYLAFDSCSFESNIFSSGPNSQEMFSDIEGLVWLFKDSSRETNDLKLTQNFYGHVSTFTEMGLYVYRTSFYSNIIQDQRSLISSSIFTLFQISSCTFKYNSLTSYLEAKKNAFIAIVPNGVKNPYAYVDSNLWEYNRGIVFLVDYKSVLRGMSTYDYVYFWRSTINHHFSPFSVLYGYYVYLIQIYTLSAKNITAASSFMIFEKRSDSIALTNVDITNITTSYNGCLALFDFRDRLTVSNVACSNATLVVPTQINNSDQNFPGLSACFTFQTQPRSYLTLTDVSCNSPTIVYEDPNIIQPNLVKALCLYISKVKDFTFTGFKCVNATYLASQNDDNLMLAFFEKSSSVIFQDSFFNLNKAVTSIQASSVPLISFTNTQVINNSFIILSSFLYFFDGELSINGVTFSNNTCEQCTGGMTIYKGKVTIQNSIFSDNFATQGSVINAKMVSLIIQNSKFIRNKATVHSSTLIGDSSNITIANSNFEANEAPSKTFTLSGGTLNIINCNFIDNTLMKSGAPYIKTLNVEVNIISTTFSAKSNYQYTTTGFFISLEKGSASIQKSSFIDGIADKGGAIYVKGILKSFVIQDCNFTRNKAVYGGALYVDGENEASNFLLENCIFINNSAIREAGSVWNQGSNTTIKSSIFKTINNETLRFGRGYYVAKNITLEGNRGYTQISGVSNSTFAIFASNVYQFNMSNSSVSGFNFDPSQATLMSSPIQFIGQGRDIYYLENISFERNSGYFGGAIYASEELDIEVNNCTFLQNFAIQGGAVYFSGSRSNLVLKGNCLFQENNATSSGGAIQYINRNIILDPANTNFSQNKAPYGDNIGGYGVYFERIPFNSTLYELYIAETKAMLSSSDRLLQSNNSANVYEYDYKTGEELYPPLMYSLKDEFGATVTYDNFSKAIIQAEKVGNSSVDVLYKGRSYYTAFMGYFILDQLAVYIGPYSGVQLDMKLVGINGSQSTPNQNDFRSIPTSAPVIIPTKDCIIGERITEIDTCVACPNGEFTLTNNSRNACNRCPESGICEGKNIYGPELGYWRLSPTDAKLNECKNNRACLGAIINDQNLLEKAYCPPEYRYNESFCFIGWCNEGYQGKLCAECREGWAFGNALLGTCTECENNFQYYLINAIFIVVGAIYIILLIKNSLKYQEKAYLNYQKTILTKQTTQKSFNQNQTEYKYNEIGPNSPTSLLTEQRMPTEKQIIIPKDHDQQAKCDNSVENHKYLESPNNKEDLEDQDIRKNPRLISNIHLRILTSYIQIMGIIGLFELEWPREQKFYFELNQAVSEIPSTMFSLNCLLKQTSIAEFGAFALRLLLISISPIVSFIILTIGWSVLYLIKYRKNFKKYRDQLKINIVVSLLVVLFVFHPSILQLSMQAFWCKVLGDNVDSTYLEADPQVICWSQEHLSISYRIALPSLILWGIGIPTLGLILLIKNRKTLKEFVVKTTYGFLYEGYKEKFYYWELVITYRKLVFIITCIFLSQADLNVKACIALGLSGIAYLLQLKYRPYKIDALNELEKRSISVSVINFYCAMFQLTHTLTTTMKILSMISLIIVNLYFFLYWVMGFAKAKSQEYLQYPRYAKRCGKILSFLADFNWIFFKKKQEKPTPSNEFSESTKMVFDLKSSHLKKLPQEQELIISIDNEFSPEMTNVKPPNSPQEQEIMFSDNELLPMKKNKSKPKAKNNFEEIIDDMSQIELTNNVRNSDYKSSAFGRKATMSSNDSPQQVISIGEGTKNNQSKIVFEFQSENEVILEKKKSKPKTKNDFREIIDDISETDIKNNIKISDYKLSPLEQKIALSNDDSPQQIIQAGEGTENNQSKVSYELQISKSQNSPSKEASLDSVSQVN